MSQSADAKAKQSFSTEVSDAILVERDKNQPEGVNESIERCFGNQSGGDNRDLKKSVRVLFFD